MIKKSEISKYPLEKVSDLTSKLLVDSEYLVDRLDITTPKDYLEISTVSVWNEEFGSATVKVTFACNKKQSKALKELLEDEDKADDLDSGIGEAFEAAIAQVYPKKKWDFCVGKTEWNITTPISSSMDSSSPRYWLLNIDREFCTIDDLRLNNSGWNYDGGGYDAAVRRDDVVAIFDGHAQKFKCLGRVMADVHANVSGHKREIRYDFSVEITSRHDSTREVDVVRSRLLMPEHSMKGVEWLERVFTPLSRAEFNDLISAWWGVSDFASELDEKRKTSTVRVRPTVVSRTKPRSNR